jgi:hypothetical protein
MTQKYDPMTWYREELLLIRDLARSASGRITPAYQDASAAERALRHIVAKAELMIETAPPLNGVK